MSAGDVAGGIDNRGYRMITYKGKRISAHRLAFLAMTGSFPKKVIDHINHIKDDNRWINLRETTESQNKRNSPLYSTNKSGYCGVYWAKLEKRWVAQIRIGKMSKRLGYFRNIDDAVAARKAAEKKYGFHPNHGKPCLQS